MSIPTYTAGYPPDGSTLGQTKVVIRDNLDGTFDTLSIDHNNQNAVGPASPGTHKWAQFQEVSGSSPPSGLVGSGYETLYAQVVSGEGDLFLTRGASGIGIQLTGPGSPSQLIGGAGADAGRGAGNTFLSGAIVLKYGFLNLSGTGTYTITYANYSGLGNFPNRCVCVVGIGQTSSSPTNDIYVVQGSTLTTGFQLQNFSASISSFNWISIGF